MKPKILLLEDDVELNDTITSFLTLEGFDVSQSFDANDAKEKVFESAFELWLFDVKVPFQSGIELLRELRSEGYKTPTIFITSLSSVEDVSNGFESGGDDYIRKPFALKELKVRVEAVIRHLLVDGLEGCIHEPERLAIGGDPFRDDLRLVGPGVRIVARGPCLVLVYLRPWSPRLRRGPETEVARAREPFTFGRARHAPVGHHVDS